MLKVANNGFVTCLKYTKMTANDIPHSYSGLIHMISVELRDSKHGFCEHSQESYKFYKSWKVEKQVGDITSNCNKYQDA